MNEDQITALAREYAEEIYPHEDGEDLGQMNFLRNNAIKHISSTLKMLLRRYCLVEKETIRKEYQETCERETYATEHKNELYAELFKMKRLTLESIFHEIAKEVEG